MDVVPTLWQALQRRQSLSTVPLLDTDVEVICLGANVSSPCEGIAFISKRVYGIESTS